MSPHPAARAARAGRALSLPANSLTLIGSKVSLMGLGFLFWLAAARLFDAAVVGLAAAVVSAMMLCTQIALVGIGSAVIRLLPGELERPRALLDTAFTIVVATSIATGLGFLALAGAALGELRVVAASPTYALLFVLATLAGTVGILLDQLSTSLRRGDHALLRGVVFGLVALAALAASAALGAEGSRALLAPWVLAGGAALALGALQLRRVLAGYLPRLAGAGAGASARSLLRAGTPNWVLTLAERAPGLVLPIAVVELLSPAANAAWYAAWMMAWVVFIVPIQVGMTLFAEISHEPAALARATRRARRVALGVGLPAAAAVGLLAEPLLGLLGERYAAAGAGPLRILVIGLVPLTLIQLYYAACRGTGRVGEAIAVASIAGLASVAAPATAGAAAGLEAMALAFVLVQAAAAGWAAVRVRALHGPGAAARAPLRRRSATAARPS